MKQLFAWFGDASRVTKKFVSDTYSQVKYSTNLVYSSLSYDNASTSFVDAWRGIAVPLRVDLTVPALWESAELREVNRLTLVNNLTYLAKALTYYMGKHALFSAIGAEDSYAELALDIAATAYLISEAIQVRVRNKIIATNANKATENYYNNKALFKGTKGKENEAQQAHYTSAIYDGVKFLAAEVVDWSPLPFSYIPATAIRIMATSHSFMGYNLELKTMEERNKIYAENNAFLAGLGFSYFAAVTLFRIGIYCFTGVNNYFVYDAVAGLIYPGFIIATRLIDKPLPGKEPGLDVFYYTNYLTEAVIKNSTDLVVKGFKEPKYDVDWLKVKNGIQHFPPYELVTWIFFPREMLSIRRFARTDPMQLFWTLRSKEIKAFLQKLLDYRESTLINFVNHWVPSWMLSEENRSQLGILFAEHTAEVIATIKEFMEEAQKKKIELASKDPNEPQVTEYEANENLIEDLSSVLTPAVQVLENPTTVEYYGSTSDEEPQSTIKIEEIFDEEVEPTPQTPVIELSENEYTESESEDETTTIDGVSTNVYDDWVDIKAPPKPSLFQKQNIFARSNLQSNTDEKKEIAPKDPSKLHYP